MMTTYLNSLGVVCALGEGKRAIAEALFTGAEHGVRAVEGWVPGHAMTLGRAAAELPAVPSGMEDRDTRNNRLLLLATQEIEDDIRAAIARFGATRVGVVVGTSTTGIEEATCNIAARGVTGAWPPGYRYADQVYRDWGFEPVPSSGVGSAPSGCTSG